MKDNQFEDEDLKNDSQIPENQENKINEEEKINEEIAYNDEASRKISMYKLKNGEKEYVDFCNNNDN